MSLAPNYSVPENVSPFKHLPMLALCSHCGEPFDRIAAQTVAWPDGRTCEGLCDRCAVRLVRHFSVGITGRQAGV